MAAAERAREVLASTVHFQNQHIMGFGALNPNPRPGIHDWSSLDARLELIRSTGGEPVITLCCSPDWMKGGEPGSTDWSRLEVAPLPEHFDDFAALAGEVARRYPDVRYFQVWNELKGFFDEDLGRWDHEAYTDLYNRVYAAVKSANPEARVGGPYVPVDSWSSPEVASHPSDLVGPWGVIDQRALDAISYWLAHADGADFVAIDGSIRTRDSGLITSPAGATTKFAAVSSWIRERTTLPIWFSEFSAREDRDIEEREAAALAVGAVLQMIDGGANVALLWGAEQRQNSSSAGLWTATDRPDGGRPRLLASYFRNLQQVLSGEMPSDPVDELAPGVLRLRSSTGTLVVRLSDAAHVERPPGVEEALEPWEVRLSLPAPGE